MSRLREISERLEAIKRELADESTSDARAAELSQEAADLVNEGVEEANRRSREDDGSSR